MCGIIGFVCHHEATSNDLDVLKKIMTESTIRGKHASGIAWCENSTIQSVVKPISIDKLVEEFDWNRLLKLHSVSLIAHARYSTSNIKYNQPIIGKSMAIVHNGVITQSEPNTWKKQYGYSCKTKNDSELILRALESGHNPLEIFCDSSISALILNTDGLVIPMRNRQRPLWMGKTNDGAYVYASTYDILNRAGAQFIVSALPLNDDLQRRNFQQWETHKLIT